MMESLSSLPVKCNKIFIILGNVHPRCLAVFHTSISHETVIKMTNKHSDVNFQYFRVKFQLQSNIEKLKTLNVPLNLFDISSIMTGHLAETRLLPSKFSVTCWFGNFRCIPVW